MKLKIEIAEFLLSCLKKYEKEQKAFDDCKKMFDEHKFSLDSYEKAEYAEEFRMFADELEVLQENIDECLYWLKKQDYGSTSK